MIFDGESAAGLFGRELGKSLGRLFSRGGLSERHRFLCTIACLQAAGDTRNLTAMLRLSISDLDDLVGVYELLLQGYLFCGYPRAIESFFCLAEALADRADLDPGAFEPRPFDSSPDLLERGRETHRLVHGRNFEKMRNKISALCPDLGYLMIAEGYGHVLSRKELEIKARELAVVSSLSAIGSNRQLNSHIRGCRNVGCDDAEIYEAIYCGLPWLSAERVVDSLNVWSNITGHDIIDSIDNSHI